MLISSLLITLMSLSISDSISKNKIPKRKNSKYGVLTTDVIPIKYTLKFIPNLQKRTFKGSAKILLNVNKKTNTVSLHSNVMVINTTLITIIDKQTDTKIPIINTTRTGYLHDLFHIVTKYSLEKGSYDLNIPEFSGILSGLTGFYYAEYVDEDNITRKFATTYFEPSSARNAFPCFDEPRFKAKFTISITRPFSYNCESNMKKESTFENTDTFEESVKMSTYLVAFVISEMQLTDLIPNNRIRTLAPPEDIAKGYASYAVDVGEKILQSIENYVNISYALDKLYLVAIPDRFSPSIGMENWGLITLKKSRLLVTNNTSTAEKQNIALAISHEVSHQWFGNLVTHQWWNHVWLAEGFASYFQYSALNSVNPNWKIMDQFVVKVTQESLKGDTGNEALVSNATSIRDILYIKGSAIIHMLKAVLSKKFFKLGLENYLRKRSFNWATSSILYQHLDEVLPENQQLTNGLSVQSIMDTWVLQKGYPFLTITRNYGSYQQMVLLRQRKFTRTSKSNTLWKIPINYATRSKPSYENTTATEWLYNRSMTISVKNLKANDWLLINKQQAYYYRVNYDIRNWNLLSKALAKNHINFAVLNRAQIIDDSFNFAKLKLLNYTIPLSISLYLKNEIQYAPLKSFFNAIGFLKDMLSGTSAEFNFNKYVRNALTRSYKHFGFEIKHDDSHIDKLSRANVINHLCTSYKHKECRNKAFIAFTKWKNGLSLIPLDLEESILCGAMSVAELDDWNYLYDKYNTSKSIRFSYITFTALGCTENANIIKRFLDLNLLINFNEAKFQTAISAITKSGSVGLEATLTYVSNHFIIIASILNKKTLNSVMTEIGSKITTEKLLTHFEAISINNNVSSFKDVFESGKFQAIRNIEWNKKHLTEIDNFLKENTKAGSATCTILTSFIVFVHVIIKIL